MSLAAYVAEDGLVAITGKRGPLQTLYAPVQRNARAKKWKGGEGSRARIGGGYRGLSG